MCVGTTVAPTQVPQLLSALRLPDVLSSSLLAPVDATSFTSAEVIGALETVRRALTSGEDILAFFDGWPGLERQTLVRAINTPGTGASAGQKAESSGAGAAVGQAADPVARSRRRNSQAVPPSAHAGDRR